MKKINIFNWKKILLATILISSLGIISITTSSCGVSSSITDNQVNTGDGTKFADGVSLQDEVKLALEDSNSSSTMKKTVVNDILYKWYSDLANGKNGRTQVYTMNQNWTTWNDNAKDEYENKVKQYKSDHKNNWVWYFQNEVMSPIGAKNKDDYVKKQVVDKVRAEFDNLVFKNNYFGIPQYNKYENDSTKAQLAISNPTDTTAGSGFKYTPLNGAIANSKESILPLEKHPGLWQDLDFYADIDRSSASQEKDLGWMYAYIQHYSWLKYINATKPVSTSMCLFSTTTTGSTKFSDVYNDKIITSTDNQKFGYNFPYFEDTGINNGVNYRFKQYVNHFKNTNPDYFISSKDESGAGLIDVPSTGNYKLTDDSSTLFRVNLGTDAYTATFIPYALATNALYQNFTTTASDMTNMGFDLFAGNTSNTISKIFPVDGSVSATADNILMKNILFTPQSSSTQTENSLPASLTHSYALGDIGNNVQNYGQGIVSDSTGVHAKIFSNSIGSTPPTNPNQWYTKGYCMVTPGYQLKDPSSTLPSSYIFNKSGVLPFVLVREQGSGDNGSGVHMIALDGAAHLQKANDSSYTIDSVKLRNNSMLTNAPLIRENDVLKFRCFQNANADNSDSDYNIVAAKGSFDFTGGSNKGLKDYYSANEEQILLEIVKQEMDSISNPSVTNDYNSAIGSSGIAANTTNGNKGGQIFTFDNNNDVNSEIANFYVFYKIFSYINELNIFQNIQSNIGDSMSKIIDFNDTATNNLVFKDYSTIWPENDNVNSIYKNGLACATPAILKNITWDNNLYFGTTLSNASGVNIANDLADSLNGIDLPLTLSSNTKPNNFFTAMLSDTDISSFISGITKMSNSSSMFKYNEYILSNNKYVNDLLWSFCGNNTGSNNVITKAYYDYLNSNNKNFVSTDATNDSIGALNSSGTLTDSNGGTIDFSEIKNALIPNYYSSAITTEGNYLQMSNNIDDFATLSGSIYNVDGYKNLIYKNWLYSKEKISNWNSDFTNGNYGVNADKIAYYQMLSALRYLTVNDSGVVDYSNFIKWLQQKLSFGKQSVFAWVDKDIASLYDPNGTSTTTSFAYRSTPANMDAISPLSGSEFNNDILNTYQWKSDYMGWFNNSYSNVNNSSSTLSYNTTHISNDAWSKYADINVPSTTNKRTLFGYKGLVTSSSGLDTDPGNALFTNFLNSNPYRDTDWGGESSATNKAYTGALYQFNKLGNWSMLTSTSMPEYTDTKDNPGASAYSLCGAIYNARNDKTSLQALNDTINKLIPNYSSIYNEVNNWIDYTTGQLCTDPLKMAQFMINALTSLTNTTSDPSWTQDKQDEFNYKYTNKNLSQLSNFFDGINGTKGPMELINPSNPNGYTKNMLFENDTTNLSESRVLFEQISYSDLLSASGSRYFSTPDVANAIFNSLTTKFGTNIIYQLLTQAAADSSIQDSAKQQVIKLFKHNHNDKLLTVYDRRFNDQLNKTWIDNYKDKN